MKFEILAPAGSMESLVAGVRSGANAIYLGGKSFNARRNAGNFDNEEMKKAVEYCHQRGVKVYLTLNIIVSDEEMREAYNAVKDALSNGIDAFIVQDIGVAKMIREHFPTARLHGSTQMSIMSPSGAKAAEQMGFKRIVLPREMSLDEIKEIRENTSLELELFVHGALCMSVSGQCYLSSMIGSRSGNRGLCAQPCRLPFTAGGNATHALSLKDLSLVSELDKLVGITSLKIEGRMKRPEYVSAAVSAVKKAIDGKYTPSDEFMLRSVFSRSGFTDGYLNAKLGKNMFGTRQKEDVVSASNSVLKEIAKNYEKEVPLLPVNIDFVCKNGENALLKMTSGDKSVKVVGDVPENAINKPMTAESLTERLGKLGGTQFYANEVNITVDEGLILPASKINEMRREAVEKLNKTDKISFKYKAFDVVRAKAKNSTPYATASFKSAAQIPDKHPFKTVFIPIDSSVEDFVDNRAGVVLPRGLFGIENELKSKLEKLKKAGVSKALCGNIGSYQLCKDMGFEVWGDFGLNVFNSVSANLVERPILSFELTQSQINNINAPDTGMLVYGYAPLMLTRNCPIKNDIGCFECNGHGHLTDRKGMKFPVICSDFPCVEMLNCVPTYMLDRLDEIHTDFIHFAFTVESEKQVENIISLYKSGAKPDFKYTRGLYQRGAL
ncbi:MAG: U32 family peptidase [Eubacteriales bacterium]|nr:U32 family peptidase [Eubacteriales bacterium]